MSFAILVKISTIDNPNAPSAIILNKKRTMMGRHSEISIDTNKSHEISKHHALMMHDTVNEKLCWLLEDRQSLNGTFVNGKKIMRQILHNKDEVIFGGGSSLKFSDYISQESSWLSECFYRFYTPEIPFSFDKCSDLHVTLTDEEETEECCICFVALHKMEALPCGHSFCSHCLNHWIKVCAKSMRPSLCPVCRRPFTRSDISQEDISIQNGIFYVHSIVPLLKTLKMKSIDEIERFRLTQLWSDATKQKFWEIYEKCLEHQSIQKIFRHYLGFTLDTIYEAETKELEIINANLDGNPYLKGEKLREEAFSRFCISILHARDLKKLKSKKNKYKNRFNIQY